MQGPHGSPFSSPGPLDLQQQLQQPLLHFGSQLQAAPCTHMAAGGHPQTPQPLQPLHLQQPEPKGPVLPVTGQLIPLSHLPVVLPEANKMLRALHFERIQRVQASAGLPLPVPEQTMTMAAASGGMPQ